MEEKRLKISVLCASRSNPVGLRTCIGALDALASGKHDVSYIAICDNDDKIPDLSDISSAAINPAPRNMCLGTSWNYGAKCNPSDIYAIVTDRSLCITPAWDTVIASAFEKDDRRPVWWTTNGGPVIPVVPHKWLEAAGQIYTDYFPFWFDDTWLHELSAMVFGLPNYQIEAMCFVHKKNPMTKRLRDLRVWMDFFIAKRTERIERASSIREVFSLKAPDMKPIEAWFKSNDEMWVRDWRKWEDVMGDKSEPDETYLQAKKMAEAFLNAKSS